MAFSFSAPPGEMPDGFELALDSKPLAEVGLMSPPDPAHRGPPPKI